MISEKGESNMDLPVQAKVFCEDGECGTIVCVIIDPISREVTHIVVHEPGFLGQTRLVPLDSIAKSSLEGVYLRCMREEFFRFENFIEYRYLEGEQPFMDYEPEHIYLLPFLSPDFSDVLEEENYLEIERIPPGEISIHRGSIVNASDGKVGRVDEFLVSPEDHHISHLVLREGHLWGEKLVTIPVSEIDHLEEDHVFLKLDKWAIDNLPVLKVKRHTI
jgi:hypothetical protein